MARERDKAAEGEPKAETRPETPPANEQTPPAPAETAVEEPVEEPEPEDAPKKTPAAWAVALGFFVKRNPLLPQSVDFAKPEHAAADALYGWSRHAFHYQAPEDRFLVTERTYRRALERAGQYPAAHPYPAAIPHSQTARFEGFRPRELVKETAQ
jgi:hypothetical protein